MINHHKQQQDRRSVDIETGKRRRSRQQMLHTLPSWSSCESSSSSSDDDENTYNNVFSSSSNLSSVLDCYDQQIIEPPLQPTNGCATTMNHSQSYPTICPSNSSSSNSSCYSVASSPSMISLPNSIISSTSSKASTTTTTALEYYKIWGISISPRLYHILESIVKLFSSSSIRISLAILIYVGIPIIFFRTIFFASNLSDYAVTLWTFWDGMFSISSIAVAFGALFGACIYAEWVALRPSTTDLYSTNSPLSPSSILQSLSPSFCNNNSNNIMSSPDGSPFYNFDMSHNNNSSTITPNPKWLSKEGASRKFSDDFFDHAAFLINNNNGNGSSDSTDFTTTSYTETDLPEDVCPGNDRCIITATINSIHRYVHARRERMFHVIFHINLWFFLIMLGVIGPNALVWPSWYWHPFLWGRYSVYSPYSLAPAIQNVITDTESLNALTYHGGSRTNDKLPLNLTTDEWDTLSTGVLSSNNLDDIYYVGKGIHYAKERSGGIIITVLARNVIDYIDPFQLNVESLVPFFSNVAVVIFENDSDDGSREKFKAWRDQAQGYTVDLMECEGVIDCRLKKKHRDDVRQTAFDKSSAIGDMHKFRQHVVDYITTNPKYDDFSHMIVLDVDLGVSFSPLGILHSLGSKPNNPVASSGRQPFPTSFGTLITPYDINAFRPIETRQNQGLQAFHKSFCGIMSKGDRWRNECEALCPTKLIQIMLADRIGSNGDLYPVESAFNGAVLYPLNVVRSSHAKYDAGDDGQRCEHIGFNLSLKRPMFVNKKWVMNLSPGNPGGESGKRAKQTADRITFNPILAGTVFMLHLLPLAVFILAFMTLGLYVLHPIVLRLVWPVAGLFSKVVFAQSKVRQQQRRRKPFSGSALPESPRKGLRYDI